VNFTKMVASSSLAWQQKNEAETNESAFHDLEERERVAPERPEEADSRKPQRRPEEVRSSLGGETGKGRVLTPERLSKR